MPLIQKYKYLDRSVPVIGTKIRLYRKGPGEKMYKRWGDCDTYIVERHDPERGNMIVGNEDLIAPLNPTGALIVYQSEFSAYKWLTVYKLNRLQRWFGKYYLGIPLLIWIIYLIADYRH